MMKVKAKVQSQGIQADSAVEIPFEGQSEDDLRARIRFVPAPNAASAANVETVLKLRLQHETTRKGVLRLMVALSMPYSAFYAADTGTGEPNLKFNAARSGGDITVHTVITLPKELVLDVTQQKAGSAGVESAFGHLETILSIFRSLAFTSGLKARAAFSDQEQATRVVTPAGVAIDDAGGYIEIKPVGTGSEDWTYDRLSNLVGRVLSGMSAVEDDATIGVTEVQP